MVSTLHSRAAPEEGQRCRGQRGEGGGRGGPQTDGSWKWFRQVEQAEDGIPKYHVALQPSSRDSKGCGVHYYDVAHCHQCGAHVLVGLPVEHAHTHFQHNHRNMNLSRGKYKLQIKEQKARRKTALSGKGTTGISVYPKRRHRNTGTSIAENVLFISRENN